MCASACALLSGPPRVRPLHARGSRQPRGTVPCAHAFCAPARPSSAPYWPLSPLVPSTAQCACALRSGPLRLRPLHVLRPLSPPVRLGGWLGFLGPQGSAYTCCPFGRLRFSYAGSRTRCLSPGHLPSTPEPALPRGLFVGLEVARAGPPAAAAGPASAFASPRRLVSHTCLTIQIILSKDS